MRPEFESARVDPGSMTWVIDLSPKNSSQTPEDSARKQRTELFYHSEIRSCGCDMSPKEFLNEETRDGKVLTIHNNIRTRTHTHTHRLSAQHHAGQEGRIERRDNFLRRVPNGKCGFRRSCLPVGFNEPGRTREPVFCFR